MLNARERDEHSMNVLYWSFTCNSVIVII